MKKVTIGTIITAMAFAGTWIISSVIKRRK